MDPGEHSTPPPPSSSSFFFLNTFDGLSPSSPFPSWGLSDRHYFYYSQTTSAHNLHSTSCVSIILLAKTLSLEEKIYSFFLLSPFLSQFSYSTPFAISSAKRPMTWYDCDSYQLLLLSVLRISISLASLCEYKVAAPPSHRLHRASILRISRVLFKY